MATTAARPVVVNLSVAMTLYGTAEGRGRVGEEAGWTEQGGRDGEEEEED